MPRDAKRHGRVAASMSKPSCAIKPSLLCQQEAPSFCRYQGGGNPLQTRKATQLRDRLHRVGHHAQQRLQLYHVQVLGRHLDPESLLVAMARERGDAQLEGCGAWSGLGSGLG